MKQSPLRILAVVTDAFGAAGGMAKFNRDLLRALAAEHVVTALPLLCKPQGGAIEQPPAQLRYITQVARWRYFAAQRMWPAVAWAVARHGPFDLIVCGHLYLLPVCHFAQRLSPGARLAQVVHGIEAWEPTPRPQVNRLTSHIDALWSVSAVTAERFAAWALPRSGLVADPSHAAAAGQAHGAASDQAHDRAYRANSGQAQGADSGQARQAAADQAQGADSGQAKGADSGQARQAAADQAQGADSGQAKGADSGQAKGRTSRAAPGQTHSRVPCPAYPAAIPISVLPNCIDAHAFGPGPKDPQLLQRLGLQNRTVLLTLGRMAAAERYKGVDTLLELMPQIRARHPQAAYLVVGDGDDRARLQAKAHRMGLTSHVRFTGSVPESSKAAHYRLADCFVMPGRGEGFGIVYLEALACGVPVVASRADGSYEAVREGRLGEVADPDDPSSILAAIDAALQRPRGVPEGLEHFSREAFDGRLRHAADALRPSRRMRPPVPARSGIGE